tara:strand:- start:1461 stop:1679 length:219 start_codon:yes stop_codon:yes gene_type:complete
MARENTQSQTWEHGVSDSYAIDPSAHMCPAWVSGYDFSGQISEAEMKDFPHLLKWIDRIAEVCNSSQSELVY